MDETPVTAPDALRVAFVPTVDDQVHSTRATASGGFSRGQRVWLLLLMFLMAVNVFNAIRREGAAALRGFGGLSLVILIMVAVGLVGWRSLLRLALARHARSHRDLYQPVVMTFGRDGLRVESKIATTEVPWSSFTRVQETGELFLLHASDSRAYFVPRRALPERDEPRLRAILRGHLGERAELMQSTDG